MKHHHNVCHLNKNRTYDKRSEYVKHFKKEKKVPRIPRILNKISTNQWCIISEYPKCKNSLFEKILVSNDPVKHLLAVQLYVEWFSWKLFIEYLHHFFLKRKENFIIKRPYELFNYLDAFIHSFYYFITWDVQCMCSGWLYQCDLCKNSSINTNYLLAWCYRNNKLHLNSFFHKQAFLSSSVNSKTAQNIIRYILDSPRDNKEVLNYIYDNYRCEEILYWYELLALDDNSRYEPWKFYEIMFYLKMLGLPSEIQRIIMNFFLPKL